MGLIKENGDTEPVLKKLVSAKGDERKGVLREIIEEKYADAFQLAHANASIQQLQDLFRKYGVQAGTLERAVRFFLDACKYTGAKCSPLWVATKKTVRKTARKEDASGKDRSSERTRKEEPANANVRTVSLKSGGTLSLSLSVDLMTLSREDRDWLFMIVDQLNAYGQPKEVK